MTISFRARGHFILTRDDGTAKFYPKGDHALRDDHPDAAHFYFIANTDPIDGDGNVIPRDAPASEPNATTAALAASAEAIRSAAAERDSADEAVKAKIASEAAAGATAAIEAASPKGKGKDAAK